VGLHSLGPMPTLPHPLTLEDHALAANRLKLRRALWEQTRFEGIGNSNAHFWQFGG